MRYQGKRAIVTGAGSGIGRATALQIASEGARVLCCDIDESTALETAVLIEKQGGEARGASCNVADRGEVHAIVWAAVEAFGGLENVFNVAGIGGLKHTEDVTEEEWDRILDVNLKGTFLVSQAALPHLLAQPKSAIANVASAAGINGQPYSAAYCASKFGVVGLTKALAIEFVKRGLRVNCVCPAAVKTPLIGKFLPPEGFDPDLLGKMSLVHKFTQPEEVASMLAYLGSTEARSINGAAVPLDFGNAAA
jgi:NAD(P)-dependent dehydrogenase (short-subunit alcohol dehydrogenase family)